MSYEEEIIRDAAEKLRANNRIQIVVEKVEERIVNTLGKPTPVIIMTFKLGQNKNHQMLSCEKENFHDVQKASELPLVKQLVKLEMADRMSERDFILMCFAAWIYKVGLHYRYF